MSFKEFLEALNGKGVEGELIKTMFYSLVSSFILLVIFYFGLLKNNQDFIPKYALYIFLATISYAIITPTIRQVRAHQELPCMSGMMVGMTIGMVSGFLPGFYVAATNGMFIGSIFGMLIGISIGAWNGKCCGIMGVMEGIMAGFMGGLMGAMTSFMLLNDHLRAAAVIVFLISAVIVISLNYMIYKEMKQIERKLNEDHFITTILTMILVIVTTWLIAFGPRSALFS